MDHTANHEYEVLLLGRPIIMRSGAPLAIKRRKLRIIVYYLAAQGKPVEKEKLRLVFWPDSNEESARKNLNVCVYEIRQQAPGLIRAQDEYVEVSSDAFVDVVEFRRADRYGETDPSAYERALALWRDDFLVGASRPELPDYEEWRLSEQTLLQSLRNRYLMNASQARLGAGDSSGSIQFLTQLIDADPLQEQAYCALMTARADEGDLASVEQAYGRLSRALYDQLGELPSRNTKKLYDRLMNKVPFDSAEMEDGNWPLGIAQLPTRDDAVSTLPDMGNSPLVGRDSEVDFVYRVCTKPGFSITSIKGSAGMGKSRVANEVLLSWQGYYAIAGCHLTAYDPPYQPIVSALESVVPHIPNDLLAALAESHIPLWWSHLVWLVPQLDQTGLVHAQEPGTFRALVSAVALFFDTLSLYKPVLIVFENIHYAPESTLTLLRHLIVQTLAHNVAVVATMNAERKNPGLAHWEQRLLDDGVLQRVELKPLSATDVEEYATSISASHATELGAWLYVKSKGNPRIMVEYGKLALQAIADNGDSAQTIDDITSSTKMPPGIQRYLGYVFNELPPVAQQVLNVAGLMNQGITTKAVAECLGKPEEDVFDAFDELVEQGLFIALEDETFCFHHDILADFAKWRLSPPRRRYLNAKLDELT